MIIVNKFIKECDIMTAIKERIMGAVALMSNEEAETFWNLIQSRYIISPKTWKNWDNIEEIEPDEFDLQMLREIENNPECKDFITSEEAMKELGL